MTQSTILAAGQSAATSSDVTVTADKPVTVGLFNAALGAPTVGTLTTDDTGGELTDGTYYYRVSAINHVGETTAAVEKSIVVPEGTETNTTTIPWTKVAGATGYRIYGRGTGAELLIAEVGDVAEYTDDGTIEPAGALPSADTTATGVPPLASAVVRQDTPGQDNAVFVLSGQNLSVQLDAPGTYRIHRPDISAHGCNVGVFKEVDA